MGDKYFENIELNKKIIDFNLKESKRQNEILYNSRQELRMRYITVFSILIASLGVILGISKDFYFEDNHSVFTLPNYIFVIFILSLIASFILFLIFLIGKIYIVEDPYYRMSEITENMIRINPNDEEIILTNEKLIVERDYYHKLEQVKAYKASNDSIIKSMKTINFKILKLCFFYRRIA